MKCHYCEENEAEYNCSKCGQPTCEDCLVACDSRGRMIEDTICSSCYTNAEFALYDELEEEYAWEQKQKQKREERNRKARERYWRPENVKKRRKMKIEKERIKRELAMKQMKELGNIMGKMFN